MAVIIIIVFLAVSVMRFETEMEKCLHCSRGGGSSAATYAKAESRRIKKLCLCVAVYGIAITTLIALRFVSSVTLTMPFLVIVAIMEPASKLIIPIMFIVHLHGTVVQATDHTHNDYKDTPHSSEDRERLIKSDNSGRGNVSSGSNSSSGSGTFSKKERGMKSLGSEERGGYFGEITGSLRTTDTERSELSSTI